ncbi:MAG: tetratricopeptide repeat protein [Nitrospiraceae bacterium]|nr:MAG: tetratricopeptide repeat protein [Nitrospiraceae bacterium]
MSLLADLLSKIKQPQTTRDVPPNLKNIVQSSAKKSANTRRIVLLSVLVSVAILTGVLLVYFTRSLSERSASSISMAPQGQMAGSERTPVAPGKTDEHPPEAPPVQTDLKPAPVAEQADANIPPSASARMSVPDKKQGKRADMLPELEQVIVRKEGVTAQAESKDESSQDAYLYSARELEMKHDYQGALSNYRKALELDKNNFTVMNNIAYIYLKTGQIQEAASYSRMALEVNRDYVPALINLGIASAQSGSMQEAEEYLVHALKIDPNDQTVLLNIGLLYERIEDHVRASEYFSQLSRYGNSSGSLGLARIREKEGNLQEALRLYRAAYADSGLDARTREEVKQRIMLLQREVQGKY